jgi:hypothetical protein
VRLRARLLEALADAIVRTPFLSIITFLVQKLAPELFLAAIDLLLFNLITIPDNTNQ